MQKRKIIVVVDDEKDILELLEFYLSREGYVVTCFSSGEEALYSISRTKPDLIILDLMLPGKDGFEVVEILKKDPDTREIPIVMLTAKSEMPDIIKGLEFGADDYVTKPFSPRVLLARIRAVLRSRKPVVSENPSVTKSGDIMIDLGRRVVLVDGKKVNLTFSEFEILNYMAKKSGCVLTREEIIDAIHGKEYSVADRSVDVQVYGLRKKLGNAGIYIETIRGVGYRLTNSF